MTIGVLSGIHARQDPETLVDGVMENIGGLEKSLGLAAEWLLSPITA